MGRVNEHETQNKGLHFPQMTKFISIRIPLSPGNQASVQLVHVQLYSTLSFHILSPLIHRSQSSLERKLEPQPPFHR